jgi:hypothetical protein
MKMKMKMILLIIEASLASAEVSAGAVAKADQYEVMINICIRQIEGANLHKSIVSFVNGHPLDLVKIKIMLYTLIGIWNTVICI